jgi:integrase
VVKINEKYLSSLKPTPREQFHRDDAIKGFGVKVNPTGRISFIAEGRVRKGQTRRITLGQYPALSLKDAKEIATTNLSFMQKGIDPVVKERKEKARENALSKTLNDVFSDYCSQKDLKPKTLYDYKNTFSLTLSEFADSSIRDISRKDIFDLFIKIRRERGDSTAAKFKRIGSAVFKFAMADDVDGERLIKENPFNIISEKGINIPAKKRDGFLPDADISKLITFYMNYDNWPFPSRNGVTRQGINYVILLMTTGLRKSEALTLKWENVDWTKKTFTAFETKNKSNHIVPMSSTQSGLWKSKRKLQTIAPLFFLLRELALT